MSGTCVSMQTADGSMTYLQHLYSNLLDHGLLVRQRQDGTTSCTHMMPFGQLPAIRQPAASRRHRLGIAFAIEAKRATTNHLLHDQAGFLVIREKRVHQLYSSWRLGSSSCQGGVYLILHEVSILVVDDFWYLFDRICRHISTQTIAVAPAAQVVSDFSTGVPVFFCVPFHAS